MARYLRLLTSLLCLLASATSALAASRTILVVDFANRTKAKKHDYLSRDISDALQEPLQEQQFKVVPAETGEQIINRLVINEDQLLRLKSAVNIGLEARAELVVLGKVQLAASSEKGFMIQYSVYDPFARQLVLKTALRPLAAGRAGVLAFAQAAATEIRFRDAATLNKEGERIRLARRRVAVLDFADLTKGSLPVDEGDRVANAMLDPIDKRDDFLILSRDHGISAARSTKVAPWDYQDVTKATLVGRQAEAEVIVTGKLSIKGDALLVEAQAINVLTGQVAATEKMSTTMSKRDEAYHSVGRRLALVMSDVLPPLGRDQMAIAYANLQAQRPESLPLHDFFRSSVNVGFNPVGLPITNLPWYLEFEISPVRHFALSARLWGLRLKSETKTLVHTITSDVNSFGGGLTIRYYRSSHAADGLFLGLGGAIFSSDWSWQSEDSFLTVTEQDSGKSISYLGEAELGYRLIINRFYGELGVIAAYISLNDTQNKTGAYRLYPIVTFGMRF